MTIAELNLSELNGSNGFVIRGIDENDLSGGSISAAGDINGDGIDDFIIGAENAAPNGALRAGESYVVFGSSDNFDASLDLANLNGSNGFIIKGINERDRSGTSVSGAGDINGDGIDDLIIGAPGAGTDRLGRRGASYVVFGSENGFEASLDLSSLDGSNGFVLSGSVPNGFFGGSVSSAGDINGDGFDDLVIGASRAEPQVPTGRYDEYAGLSYVVYGSEDEFNASLNVSSLDGSNGFVINGINENDRSGFSVSGAGDINGDGLDDLVIGSSKNDPFFYAAVESYVVFGSNDGFDDSLDLINLNGGNGFVLRGINPFDFPGSSVSDAGDINGDGIDDIIIGAYGGDTTTDRLYNAGESYVVFGSVDGFDSSLDLSSLDGNNGFTLNGINESDYSGRSVSGAGDVNGDGIDDIIIGAYGADPNGQYNAGESYIVFGSTDEFDASLDLSSLNNAQGFVVKGINESDYSGRSVSRAGDINGDGIDDFIIGANNADPNGQGNAGESYVIFGLKFGEEIEGTPGRDILRGSQGDDTLMAFAGNDKLTGKSGNDLLVGGEGNDFLLGGTGFDTLEGGGGRDRFVFQNPRQTPDRILDFDASEDLILIKQTGFDLNFKGRLPQSRFVRGGVRDRNDRFIYKASSGELLFDADGRGGQVAKLIALLNPGDTLNARNIRII